MSKARRSAYSPAASPQPSEPAPPSYRRRGQLELTPLEAFDTRASIRAHLLSCGIGALSAVLALTVPLHLVGLAGYVYFLFGPVLALHGTWSGKRRKRLEKSA